MSTSNSQSLSSLQSTMNQSIQFETQLAQMQMQFETQLDAAKAEKDAATAIQSQG